MPNAAWLPCCRTSLTHRGPHEVKVNKLYCPCIRDIVVMDTVCTCQNVRSLSPLRNLDVRIAKMFALLRNLALRMGRPPGMLADAF